MLCMRGEGPRDEIEAKKSSIGKASFARGKELRKGQSLRATESSERVN